MTKASPAPFVAFTQFQVLLEDVHLCDPMTLSLTAGSCVHLKGPNGIGKTKCLEALVGLYPYISGHVKYQGRIGFVSTKQPFDDQGTVHENLQFWSDMLGQGGDYLNKIESMLSLSRLLHKPVHSLSAGQKQLVNLAQRFLQPADIWVLDEPFSFLDDQSRCTLCREIQEFCRNGGICILTSHQELPAYLDHYCVTLSVNETIGAETIAA